MPSSTWVIIRAALETVGKLVIVGFCGFIAMKKGILNHQSLRALSRLTFTFPIFCTISYRLSSSVDDISEVLDWWPLVVSGSLMIAVAAFFNRGIAYISGMCTKDARVFVHTFSFGNPTVIALAITKSVTSDTELFGNTAESTKAYSRASAYISTHLFIFSLLFWILGYIYINLNRDSKTEEALPLIQPVEEHKKDDGDEKKEQSESDDSKEEKEKHWYSPVTNFFKKTWHFISKTYKNIKEKVLKVWYKLPSPVRNILAKIYDIVDKILNPAFMGVLLGVILLFWHDAWEFLFNGKARMIGGVFKILDQATVPLCLMIVGANMAKGPKSSNAHPLTIGAGITMKYAILPACFISVIYLCYVYDVFIDDPMFVLVMCIETATPPVFNTAVLVILAYPKGANLVASLTFWGYLVDIITLTIVVAVSLLLIQDDLNV
ncbi:Auxin efflux carrier family protein [Entamoeba marina]